MKVVTIVFFLLPKVWGYTSLLNSYARFWSHHFEHQGLQYDEKFMEAKDYNSEVSMSINPGCNFNVCSIENVTLANLTVKDTPAQALEHRWLWGFIGSPTIQAAVTSPGDELIIDWENILGYGKFNSIIQYQKKPFYSGAVMLRSIIEFNDVNNTGDLSKSSEQIIYPMVQLSWSRLVVENTTKRIAIEFIGQNFSSTSPSVNMTGKINITVSAYSEDGFGLWLPHLCHSARTNQMDIQLDHINTASGFNMSRFALEFVIVSDTDEMNSNKSLTPQNTTTLDDEHTPGIFKTEELVIPGKNASLQSYLQWRPVVYTTQARDLSESTGVKVGPQVDLPQPSKALNSTLLYALYGEDLNFMLVKTFNVTLGSKDDGFYNKRRYQAWTFTFGIGKPIHNGFSPIVILVVTIMFAFLIIVFIAAGIFCGVKRWKNRRAEYARLQ